MLLHLCQDTLSSKEETGEVHVIFWHSEPHSSWVFVLCSEMSLVNYKSHCFGHIVFTRLYCHVRRCKNIFYRCAAHRVVYLFMSFLFSFSTATPWCCVCSPGSVGLTRYVDFFTALSVFPAPPDLQLKHWQHNMFCFYFTCSVSDLYIWMHSSKRQKGGWNVPLSDVLLCCHRVPHMLSLVSHTQINKLTNTTGHVFIHRDKKLHVS